MEQKIIIRHRHSSKAEKVDEFPIKLYRSVSIGRDPSCEIIFDQDKDDVVSRMHSRINIAAGQPPAFKVADLGSRNGTFLNRQRISSEVALTPGDVIQLGPGGPELEFDVEPRALGKPTRLATEIPAPLMTREAAPVSQVTPVIPPAAPKSGVGKGTVERMIQRSEKKNHAALAVAGVAVVVALALGGYLFWKSRQPAAPAGDAKMSPAQVAAANTDSVVFFEVGWKIVDTESGRQLYHVYMANKTTDESGAEKQLVPGGPPLLPVFVPLGNGIEPMLSTSDGGGSYKAVGGRHTGSGFVVSSDGFILTNRHVASTWLTSYTFPDPVGVVLTLDEQAAVKQITPIGARSFPSWVPGSARFVIEGGLDQGNIRIVQKGISGKSIEGRNDYLDVTFAKNRVRIPGKLARVSDQIDVAMVKIDIPRSLRKVELFDNYGNITQGEQIVVLGYPAASPVVVGAVESKDVFNRGVEAKVIPDPTLSVGNIGRIIRGQAGIGEGTYSTFGDVYQLTVNSTGPGNSGGPVFDDKGRVIGIFTSGTNSDVRITFAVPIKYGMELMGTNRVM
ncbi:MAG: trypsin-like peptidase domain-containing protein [Bryobacteraceae bacterium]|nr:trypsin-like peptidase domain-containing protein [Bryobacteraceae bacterium]